MKLEKAEKKSVFKRPWFWLVIAVAIIGVIAIVGSGDSNDDLQGSVFDSNIDMVKKGSPELIPDITYGQAYENFFANPQWRGFTADTGEHVVEFTGDCTYYDEDAQVYIQFVIESETSFSMYYAHLNVGGETISVDEQTFVELVYTPFKTYSEEVLGRALDDDVERTFEEIYNSYY